ncbi:hypothetical protein FHR66_003906 [Xanthomonas sp. F4]
MEKPLIVTLEAAFAGFTFLLWFAWAHNSLNTKLILHADYVEYRGTSLAKSRITIWTSSI